METYIENISIEPIASLSREKRSLIARQILRNYSTILKKWRSEFDHVVNLNNTDPIQNYRNSILNQFDVKLELLRQYIRTGQVKYWFIYLDEWSTIATWIKEGGKSSLNKLLSGLESNLIQVLEITDIEREKIGQSLRFIHAPLEKEPTKDDVRILALGDCLIGTIRRFLPYLALEARIGLQFRHMYFSATQGQDMSTEQATREVIEFQPDLIAISFLSYRGLPQFNFLFENTGKLGELEIDRHTDALIITIRRYLDELRNHTDAPFILHNVSGLPLSKWRNRIPFLSPHSTGQKKILSKLNQGIQELAENHTNTLLLDETTLAASIGYHKAWKSVIPKAIAQKAEAHIERFGVQLAGSYMDILRSFITLRRIKLILVDFDNTLWQGVMADGPVIQNLPLQSLLLKLKEAGIVLAAVSKNDPKNIRWDEMQLNSEDFVRLKINWNLKVQSIEEIAHELDLGLDSFVLLDDTPEERALVSQTLPQVTVLDPAEAFTLTSLERLISFPNTRQTEEAKKRTEMYRAQAERKEELSKNYDYPSMMASLKLIVRFGVAKKKDLSRIEELVQRTNQFNSTTRRYTRSQLQAFLYNDSHTVFVAELEDRFSSLGLVAVVIVKRSDSAGVIDSFIMSCRAMGFGLETAMLRLVIDEIMEKQVIGEYIPTDRNEPAKNLFSDGNFELKEENIWILNSTRDRPEIPSWLTIQMR